MRPFEIIPKSASDRIIMTYYEAGHIDGIQTSFCEKKLFRENLKKLYPRYPSERVI